MRTDLPRGTVTFLFTDIEGSTRLLHALGETGYAAALAQHRAALRAAFAAHDGVEVDTQGDAFFYAFPTAPAGVAAAVAGQAALQDGPIRVRMGLHTGSPTVTDEGYVGTDVHRAARIAAVAHGGQVVLSASTTELARRDDLLDLGLHRLKDLSAPERIHQVGNAAFPPLRSLYRTNLPVPATALLGRRAELADARALLERPDTRLLTLTGPGGTGKTRLALQLAGLVSDGYPDGVYWVPLAAVADPAMVATVTAATLGGGGDVATAVGSKRLLLLLDNLEHLLAAAPEVAGWLTACPALDLLVTSREALRVSGEQRYAVPPLSEDDGPALFLARARAVDPDFPSSPTVSDICHRLDNLPLAIELAAARVNVLTPEQLLTRLTERLPLLKTVARDAAERHRTLRATIAWSHDLLDGDEQGLFRRLGGFTGGCTLEAAQDLLDADDDLMGSLVDKSLLRRTGDRFWMLETIREFALERLSEAGEAADLNRRHAVYYAALADSANLCVENFDRGQRHDVALPEIANLRAAIDRSAEAGDVSLALSIAVSLEQLWVVSSPHEGIQRLAALVERAGDTVDPGLRARALRVLGGCTYYTGDFDTGTRYVERALAVFRELGDDEAVGHLQLRQGFEAARLGDTDLARTLLAESTRLTKSRTDEAQRLSLLANLAYVEGRLEDSLELFLESARSAGDVEFTWWQSASLANYCETALELGRDDDAVADRAREAIGLSARISDRQGLAFGLSWLAVLATRRGDDETAGRLFGAIEAESERQPLGQWESYRANSTLLVMPQSPEFESGRRAGRALTLQQAAELAVSPAG